MMGHAADDILAIVGAETCNIGAAMRIQLIAPIDDQLLHFDRIDGILLVEPRHSLSHYSFIAPLERPIISGPAQATPLFLTPRTRQGKISDGRSWPDAVAPALPDIGRPPPGAQAQYI